MPTGPYITIRECEIRDRALHEKLDMIIDNQKRYEDKHDKIHAAIDKDLSQYKKDRGRIIGAAIVISIIIGFFNDTLLRLLGIKI